MLPGEGVDDRHQRVAALGQRAAAGEREGGKGAESGGAWERAASVEEAGERRLHSSPKAR